MLDGQREESGKKVCNALRLARPPLLRSVRPRPFRPHGGDNPRISDASSSVSILRPNALSPWLPHPIPILSVHLPPAYSNQTEPTTRRHFPRVQFYLLSVDCCPEYLSNVVVCRFRRVRTAASKHICPCCFHQMKAILSARSRILPRASASCSIWIRNFDSLASLLVTYMVTYKTNASRPCVANG